MASLIKDGETKRPICGISASSVIRLNLGLNLWYGMFMKVKIFITIALLTYTVTSSAQTKDSKTQPPAKTEKSAPAGKPKVDIDSFFKDAEKQTRDAQKYGNSNCVPKPIDQTPSEPVT